MRLLVYMCYLVLALGPFSLSSPPPSKIEPPTLLLLDEIGDANKFYVSVINATTNASGELKYEFQGGQATSKVTGALDIMWLLQPGTSASLKFNYQRTDAIHWKKLEFSFNRPIVAFLRQGRVDARRQQITRIEFRQNGEPLEYYDDEGHPVGLALSEFPEIRQHLRIRELSSLLFGLPFAGFGQSPVVLANGFTVKRVTLPQDSPNAPIKLGLIPESKIVFVDDGENQSWIKLSDSAQIIVQSLVYDRFARSLDGSLRPVKFKIAEGRLASGRTSLNLAAGGVVSFDHLRFWSDKSDGINCFSATDGSFGGQLRANSAVEIADGPEGASMLEVGVAEPTALDGLTVQGADNRSTISLAKARLPVTGAEGQLPFDAGNRLRIHFQKDPSLAVSLTSASWFSNQPPRVAGAIPGFSADVIEGQFLLNDRTTINIGAGQITSTGIALNFPSAHPVTGVLNQASFVIKKGTTFGLGTDRLLLKISSGSVKAAAAEGLTFSTNRVGPVGSLLLQRVVIAGGSLKFGSHGAVELESGSVDMDIRHDSSIDGKWVGKLIASTGKLMFDGANTYNIRRATLDITSQSLSDDAGVVGPFKSVSFGMSASHLNFSDNFMALTSDTGAQLDANDPAKPLSIEADGEITGRVHLVAQLGEGSVVLNPGSRIGVLPSSLVDAVFIRESHHPVTGKLTLNLRCGQGNFKLNKTTNVPITGGEIKAADLAYREPNSLTGKLNKIGLDTGPVTTVYPKALQVSSEVPSALRAGDGIGQGAGFNLGGCITFELAQKVKGGEIRLGKNSVANVVGGTLVTTQHLMCPAGQPDFTNIALDVVVSSGTIQFNEETTLKINANSHLKAAALTVSEQNGVTGSISDADIILGQSILSIPRGFKILVGPQSHMTVVAPAQHLQIDDSGTAIYGTVVFDGPMQKFFNADPTSFQLRNGTMHFVLTQQANGRIEGHAMSLTGSTMDLLITDPAMALTADVNLTNGEFAKDPGQEARLTATIVATITPFSINKQTDCNGDHDEGRFFPIKYSVRPREGVVILSGNLVFTGDKYVLPESSRTVGLTVSVAQGQGEHEHERCNGEEGWGEMAPNQEAFTAWLGACRFHLYLMPHDYGNATANLLVTFSGSKMSMTMSGLDLREGLATDHTGCWPVGGLFEGVARIVIQNFKLPSMTFSIQHDFRPPNT